MSSHTLAVLFIAGWASSLLLAAADTQPKPRYTNAYVLRIALGLFVMLPTAMWLAIRAL